jgi:hypothetical protein
MQEQRPRPFLAALHDELDLAERDPLQAEIDVDAVRDLRAHGGAFELRFEAWGREIVVTESTVSVRES